MAPAPCGSRRRLYGYPDEAMARYFATTILRTWLSPFTIS